MSLRDYAGKRHADLTPEPGHDSAATRTGRRPIFVVQLHASRRRHYDFRLEIDGVLKSWAVPKGPSLRAGEKRLAVEVEDHPLAYASFEGDIPEGHYGAGHVDVFDHGAWSCDGDPLRAWSGGRMDFRLDGERLRGTWSLIRTAAAARQRHWLLIKRSDAHARDAEADDLLQEKPGSGSNKPPSTRRSAGARRWQKRAAALPAARRTPGDTTIDPQLASSAARPPPGDGWLHEVKWDGYRLLARIDDEGQVHLRSRNGLNWTADHPELVAALQALAVPGSAFDGELVALDEHGRSDFTALQRVLDGRHASALHYVLFDLPTLAGIDLTRVRLELRKALLQALLEENEQSALIYSPHLVGEGAAFFAESARAGLEGIVSKSADAIYSPGRSSTWLKIKHARSDEFVVVGYTPGKGSRAGFGSLLLARPERGRLTYVGRVGTGFDTGTLAELNRRLMQRARTEPVVDLPGHLPFSERSVRWVRPELIVEVAYRGLGSHGLLRQASFLRLREDKPMRDVDAPTEFHLSSPDKTLYPDAGIVKQQVADYYRAVSNLLLPEVMHRPLSLLRCPDGIARPCFFQKHHQDGLGSHVRSVELREKQGGRSQYIYIDSLEGLLELVQMNTLELHPWGSRVDDLERPDRLVFDLDPGSGIKWKTLIAAARDVRDRLAEVGLRSFPRLSGGKGVHVVVPIQPGPDWATVKGFCEAVANAMAEHAPDRYVATAAKARRNQRIFIDWLRNGRGATSIANWSLRARPAAGVAMPISWAELGRTRCGDDYPMARALRRARALRKDPWSGWREALQQTLPELD